MTGQFLQSPQHGRYAFVNSLDALRQAGLRLQQYKITRVRHHPVGAVIAELWNASMLLRRQLHRIWWIDGQSRRALRAASGFTRLSCVWPAGGGCAPLCTPPQKKGCMPGEMLICLVCVLQGVAEAECRRAAAAAEEVYVREFDQEGTPADADALLQEHLVRLARAAGS